MVNIHRHELAAAVSEERALALFRRTCDLPEASSWVALGRGAGFSAADEPPSDLYQMLPYRA